MSFISRYIYSNCSTLAIGCTLYSNYELTLVYSEKQLKVTIGNSSKIYTTSTAGVIVQISECTYNSNIPPYAPLFTSNKNDCVAGSCSVIGSTVTLNDGTPSNEYYTIGSYTSSISQADADYQAQLIAEATFNANKQAQVNSRGFCTYTFSSGTGTYSANFTKNNCASNCYANGTVNYSITKTGYAAQSTVSCTQASIDANASAYNAAVAEVNAGGQAYANANGSCCCWVADPACYLCYYYGNRERNTCTGAYRNDTPTELNSCNCGQGCAGTNNDYYECVNTFQQDKLIRERYNCAPYNFTGNTTYITCGCTNNQPDIRYLEPLEKTCIDCEEWFILRDFAVCSPTAGNYFAKGVNYGLNKPASGGCNTSFDGVNIGNRCMDLGLTGLTTYDVFQNNNPCGFRYRAIGGGNDVFINTLSGTAGACGPPVA